MKIDSEFVLRELLEALAVFKADVKPKLNAKTGKPIRDEEGNAVYTYSGPQVLKCLELIGKLTSVSAFTENYKVGVEDDLIARLHAGRTRAAQLTDTNT